MNNGTLTGVLVLVAVFIILTVVNVVYKQFNQKYVTETALLSAGSDSEQVQGVFVRDEKVIHYAGEGVVSYEVSDGGKLGIGSPIASIYASETQIELKQRIAALTHELELLQRISNPGTTQTAQPSSISELFNQTYKDYLYQREQGDISDLQSIREEMVVLLSTYQLVTGKDDSYAEKMQSIQAEIDTLEQSREQPLDTIMAEEAAYFVSYADGYEDKLTLEDLGSLTPETLAEVQWVLAAVVDNTEHIYQEDDTVTLKFASTSETVKGKIILLNKAAGDAQTVIAVQCETMTYDLVQHRTDSVEIIRGSEAYQGIMVPRSAQHFMTVTNQETGEPEQVRGVYVLNGEQPEFRRLDVIYEGADYVLSRQNGESGYLQLYDAIITKGIDADGQ